MSLKESNEITVKIKGKLEDFYKIIEEKGLNEVECYKKAGLSCKTFS